jgi:prepilin-type N-terminal cleavage/methylation domain-containing protein
LAGHAGFTLLEMTVVLAIIMILSLVIFSTTLRQLDRVAADKELANLNSYAEALKQSIQRNGSIPGAANWVTVVALELGAGSTTVATNDRRQARLLLVDTNSSPIRLPYNQVITGSTNPPGKLRLMLLSCLGPKPLPAALTSGTYTTADFTNLWNWAGADRTLPAGTLWTGWSGTGLDLQVQRLTLSSLFVHLLLGNYPASATNQGRYTLGTITNSVPNGTGVDTYFLKNTLVGLVNADGKTDAQLLTRDGSFLFETGVWRIAPQGPDTSSAVLGEALEQMMIQFRASKGNKLASGGATPTSVANAMDAFMSAYVQWANNNFPPTGPYYVAVTAANNAMMAQMENLAADFQETECN